MLGRRKDMVGEVGGVKVQENIIIEELVQESMVEEVGVLESLVEGPVQEGMRLLWTMPEKEDREGPIESRDRQYQRLLW